MDRVPPITLRFADGEVYTLDFNRESVKFAEDRGFRYEDVSDFPLTKISELFYYSLRANHRKLSMNQSDALLKKLRGLTPKMIERLIELYAQAINSNNVLQDEEDLAKNAEVTVEME